MMKYLKRIFSSLRVVHLFVSSFWKNENGKFNLKLLKISFSWKLFLIGFFFFYGKLLVKEKFVVWSWNSFTFEIDYNLEFLQFFIFFVSFTFKLIYTNKSYYMSNSLLTKISLFKINFYYYISEYTLRIVLELVLTLSKSDLVEIKCLISMFEAVIACISTLCRVCNCFFYIFFLCLVKKKQGEFSSFWWKLVFFEVMFGWVSLLQMWMQKLFIKGIIWVCFDAWVCFYIKMYP